MDNGYPAHHKNAYIEAERMNITHDALLPVTKKSARSNLTITAIQMLGGAIDTIGDFSLVVTDEEKCSRVSHNAPSDELTRTVHLMREPITFAKVDGIAIEVAANETRKTSLDRILRTLKCLSSSANYEGLL